MSEATAEDWKAAAEAYEKGSRETTAKPTSLMLEQMDALLPFSEASGILDNGCGPGPVMSRLIQLYGPSIPPSCTLSCADWAPSMTEQVQSTKSQVTSRHPESPWNRVTAQVLDATDLYSIPDESQSHVAAGWVYHMTKSPQKCLSETIRILKPGGVLGVASWAETQWLGIMKPLQQIKPDLKPPAGPKEWATAAGLPEELRKAGFQDVQAYEVAVEIAFESHDVFVDVLLTKMPPLVALTKDFSAAQKAELRGLMVEEIRGLCPTEPGTLKGVALVAVGRK